ncbi:3-keto-disaccharide hydrolase [Botrimarina hoheduenensis]|uniref:3-keto-alpha-glucoside-1,2-lyase/3-keto-2-hydroxy-glucal hydratase domain-containing protein n=1 Tax=Botrimarina hoheduenensis TaxID=2528000 RepID=A0A5C5W9D2_9BACT|nr:DUF1080 domain-containing protein [Botrimarina hoheduenensis]TWT47486.1 hypothetical protein Pla111_11000 [Botrimarina hoheduenensis]
MTRSISLALSVALLVSGFSTASANDWVSLFNGKDLTGWRASEHPETFRVEEGLIVANGERSHLYYVGPVCKADFRNFEWRCEVMLEPGSNSGMYFHTEYQDVGWPERGYEAQLNNTQSDRKKTGGLYDIADVMDVSPVRDNEWFTQHVIVRGKRIIVKVNDQVVTDYTEPDDADSQPNRRGGRLLSHGTIALQGHDPGSTARFRKIEVKPFD